MISAVIPTYDRLPLLCQAIDSVRAQSYGGWELIIADDGSTDGTHDYVASLADPRIRFVSLEHTGNVARVRNAAAAVARGEYLAFLDSDDVWLPEKLAVQVAAMRDQDVAWSHTRYDHIDESGRPVPWTAGRWNRGSGSIARAVLDGDVAVGVSSLMVSRRLFAEVGGFAADPWPMHEDLHLIVRLAVRARTVAVEQTLTLVRRHPGRTTSIADDGWARSAATYGALLPTLTDARLRRLVRRRRARCLTESGRRHLQRRAYGPGLGCFARALLDGPDPIHWPKALLGGLLGGRRAAGP